MISFTKLLLNKAGLSHRLRQGRISHLAVWNITKQCNFICRHCYISADNRRQDSELSTEEAKKVIDSLAGINTPMVLFSGGEPLLRGDIFELINYGIKKGMKCALSSNGTLINAKIARHLKYSGVIYVGVSIDGSKTVHDRFRGKNSFDKAFEGLKVCQNAGIPVGVRFTINNINFRSLPYVFDKVLKEKIRRFCMYHLVYSGRATKWLDISKKQRKEAIDYLIKRIYGLANDDLEVLTVDNPCDGIYLYKHIVDRFPQRGESVLNDLLYHHGRCSAGERILSISPQGDVHNCQFWNYQSVGNIRNKSLLDIWKKAPCAELKKLRNKESFLKGKCGMCKYAQFCGGCRLRAKEVYNDIWEEDPSCYLSKKDVYSRWA